MGKAYEGVFTTGLAPEACCIRFFPGLLTGPCVLSYPCRWGNNFTVWHMSPGFPSLKQHCSCCLTCNASFDCFGGYIAEFWIPPLIWEPVIHCCWTTVTQIVYLLSQIWQQWFGSDVLSPFGPAALWIHCGSLSNHVHASYRGTSLYRSLIDSGGRIIFCAVLPEHTCTVALEQACLAATSARALPLASVVLVWDVLSLWSPLISLEVSWQTLDLSLIQHA